MYGTGKISQSEVKDCPFLIHIKTRCSASVYISQSAAFLFCMSKNKDKDRCY